METCICGHDKNRHNLDGNCLVLFGIKPCLCSGFVATTDEIISPKQALEELVATFSPTARQRQHEQIEANRPHGICPRCHNEHILDPLGIVVSCMAVQQVSFNADGGIGSIDFGVIPHQPGVVMVSGIDGGTFDTFRREFDNLTKRITAIENRFRAQADEPICYCGHGLGEHESGDGCKQCSCRAFSLF